VSYVFSLLKLHYNIHNLIRFCKQGAVAECRVVQEYVVESAVGYGVRRVHTTHTIANCTLNNVLLHNMICCHSTLFTETN